MSTFTIFPAKGLGIVELPGVMLTERRQKRMAELSSINTKSVYNQVYPLQKPDWSRDVTEESRKAFVFVLLTSSQGMNVESRLLVEFWRELALVYGDVKFGQIRAELCIEGYPDRNTPTILVYKDGDVKKQIVTLLPLKGTQTKLPGKLQDLLPLPNYTMHANLCFPARPRKAPR